jgi:hypothetical protein
MRCPRCGEELATFAVEGADGSALVCESCGFAGIPASHRPESLDPESWERAVNRFDATVFPPERTCRTVRSEAVDPPTDESDPEIDPARLEETVAVAASLGDGDTESG